MVSIGPGVDCVDSTTALLRKVNGATPLASLVDQSYIYLPALYLPKQASIVTILISGKLP